VSRLRRQSADCRMSTRVGCVQPRCWAMHLRWDLGRPVIAGGQPVAISLHGTWVTAGSPWPPACTPSRSGPRATRRSSGASTSPRAATRSCGYVRSACAAAESGPLREHRRPGLVLQAQRYGAGSAGVARAHCDLQRGPGELVQIEVAADDRDGGPTAPLRELHTGHRRTEACALVPEPEVFAE